MGYDSTKHHRRSIRLKGYDYSQPGTYFVTICSQNRKCLFGDVVDGTMVSNGAGQMIETWYNELENKFPDIVCGSYVIMPNHMHFLITNVGADLRVSPEPPPTQFGERGLGERGLGERGLGERGLGERGLGERGLGEHTGSPLPDKHVGADPRVYPEPQTQHNNRVGADLCVCPEPQNDAHMAKPGEHGLGEYGLGEYGLGEPVCSPLHRVVQWFKTMTTNAYIRGVKQLGWVRFDRRLWQRNYYERIIRDEDEWGAIRQYIINNPAKWEFDNENPNVVLGGKHG